MYVYSKNSRIFHNELCGCVKRINPQNREWIRKKTECERFFRSWWFGVLTDADPAVILDGLKKEAAV